MSARPCPACGAQNTADAVRCTRCHALLTREPTSLLVLNERWQVQLLPSEIGEQSALVPGADRQGDDAVLVQLVPPSFIKHQSTRNQVFQEARLLSRLRHPSLTRVLDIVETPQHAAIIYAHPNAPTLQTFLLTQRMLPVGLAIALVKRLLEVLGALHDRGLVHRQLTSQNIFIQHDQLSGQLVPIISHFSLASPMPAGVDGGRAASGTLMGMRPSNGAQPCEPTPYTAPELLTFEAEAASDLYAVGAILFELLTGRHAISAPSTDRLIHRIHTEAPALLRSLRPELSAELEALLANLLHKLASRRHASAAAALRALEATPEASFEVMLPIPAGTFTRGARHDDPDARKEELPSATIALSAFWIDRTPVTCAQFAAFIEATNRQMPPEWFLYNDNERAPTLPVVFVTWQDAADYARWARKRLPTEAEWERAARGRDGRTYPWGEQPPNPELAQYDGRSRPAAVGSHPAGASPCGVLDMAGNVFEWVHDWFDRSYYHSAPAADPSGPETGAKKVLRGGSFVHPAFALRCAARGRYNPMERRANHSFRCAWSLDPQS